MNEPLKTVEELADFLNVKKSWVYKETRQKGPDTIPMIRVGRYPRFDIPTTLEWFKKKSMGA